MFKKNFLDMIKEEISVNKIEKMKQESQEFMKQMLEYESTFSTSVTWVCFLNISAVCFCVADSQLRWFSKYTPGVSEDTLFEFENLSLLLNSLRLLNLFCCLFA